MQTWQNILVPLFQFLIHRQEPPDHNQMSESVVLPLSYHSSARNLRAKPEFHKTRDFRPFSGLLPILHIVSL